MYITFYFKMYSLTCTVGHNSGTSREGPVDRVICRHLEHPLDTGCLPPAWLWWWGRCQGRWSQGGLSSHWSTSPSCSHSYSPHQKELQSHQDRGLCLFPEL